MQGNVIWKNLFVSSLGISFARKMPSCLKTPAKRPRGNEERKEDHPNPKTTQQPLEVTRSNVNTTGKQDKSQMVGLLVLCHAGHESEFILN